MRAYGRRRLWMQGCPCCGGEEPPKTAYRMAVKREVCGEVVEAGGEEMGPGGGVLGGAGGVGEEGMGGGVVLAGE